jgi:hypothetical protein
VAIEPLRIEGRATVVEETRANRLIGSRNLRHGRKSNCARWAWLSTEKAAILVDEPQLIALIQNFAKLLRQVSARAGLGPND